MANATNTSNYKLGIGDTLTLTLLRAENPLNQINPKNDDSDSNQNFIINSQPKDVTIKSTGRIGSDGSVLLLEVGRLEANGKLERIEI